VSIIGFVLSALTLWSMVWLVVWMATNPPQLTRPKRDLRVSPPSRISRRVGGRCASGGHWPRVVVHLADGTTVAHICRRCDHDWADEHWVKTGHEVKP